jgi:hypothetical protein
MEGKLTLGFFAATPCDEFREVLSLESFLTVPNAELRSPSPILANSVFVEHWTAKTLAIGVPQLFNDTSQLMSM